MGLVTDCVYLLWSHVFVILGVGVIGLVGVAALWLHYIRKKYEHIPGPPRESFWLGNVIGIQAMKKKGKFMADYILESCLKYGHTIRFSMAHMNFVAVTDPDSVKELLVTGHYPKPKAFYKGFSAIFGQRFLGNGLVGQCDSTIAAKHRLILNPWFQRSYLRRLVDEFNTCTETLMSRLSRLADGQTRVRMLTEYNHISLDILCKVGVGMEINSVDKPDNPFTSAVIKAFEGASDFTTKPFTAMNPLNWKYLWEVRKSIQFLRDFGKKTLQEREDAIKRGDYIPDDVISLLLKYKEDDPEIDPEDLLDEFLTFFVAGQETTSSLLTFMMMTLGQNPQVFKKLQAEIDEVVGEKPVITYEDIGQLTYLDMVFKETLRIYPPGPGTMRELTKDHVIGGYKLPKGTMILISLYAMQHMEEYFDNPWEFRPERFAEGAERISTYTYFPFVIGARSCIGKHFAEIEAKIVMTKFVQRFEFELAKDQSFDMLDTITVKPKDGAICYLRNRN